MSYADIDSKTRREIARKAGKASAASPRHRQWGSKEAAAAGRIGGSQTRFEKAALMVAIRRMTRGMWSSEPLWKRALRAHGRSFTP